MAITPERNDIDISKLFTWGKKVELVDSNGETLLELYMRILSDEDVNRSRIYALRKAAELRKKLRIQDSDERLAYIQDKDDFDTEGIIETVLVTELPELASKVYSEMDFPFPKEPKSDASLEQVEKYQEELDNWEDNRSIAIREELDKITKKKREEYAAKDINILYKMYESAIINDLCQKEMLKQFKNITLFNACFVDEKYTEKLFSVVEQVSDLPRELKEQLITHYNSLDITTEELKK